MTKWYEQGKAIGEYAETLDHGLNGTQPVKDPAHHIGDDMGELITKAFREGGVGAAVEALTGYFDGFNDGRRAHNRSALTPEYATKNLAWAFGSEDLNEADQEAVRKAFRIVRP